MTVWFYYINFTLTATIYRSYLQALAFSRNTLWTCDNHEPVIRKIFFRGTQLWCFVVVLGTQAWVSPQLLRVVVLYTGLVNCGWVIQHLSSLGSLSRNGKEDLLPQLRGFTQESSKAVYVEVPCELLKCYAHDSSLEAAAGFVIQDHTQERADHESACLS